MGPCLGPITLVSGQPGCKHARITEGLLALSLTDTQERPAGIRGRGAWLCSKPLLCTEFRMLLSMEHEAKGH